ncbi:MAG: AtzH-like domain-containing protein [Acidimicrobiales bacterium]
MDVDLPEVRAEVLAVFERYEAALQAGDLDVLDELFWDDARVVRVGLDDRQDGHAAVRAFRRGQACQSPPRRLHDTVVVTFGTGTAVVTTAFVPTDGSPPGRQSQTWVRLGGRWLVVVAHVSRPVSDTRQATDTDP